MAVDFVCGWECRIALAGAVPTPDERHWDAPTTATVLTIDTSTVRSGTASLRTNATGTADSLQKLIARTTVAGRVYVRFASFAASAFVRNLNANGNLDCLIDGSGNVTVKAGAGTAVAVGTLSLNTWYRLDWLADTSTGTASMKARIDGGTEATATNAQVSANMTAVHFGPKAAVTIDIFYDDLILGTASGDYPFGAGTVERMKPTRDGSHSFTANDFRYNAAGANILTSATDVNTYVDDDALSTITDFIAQRVVRSTGYVEVGFGTAPFTHDAQAVNVVSSWHASTTGANTVGLKMNDGGTLQNMLDESGDGLADYSQTTVVYSEKVLTAPPSGGTWTKAKLDAVLLRMGYSTDVVGEPFWDGVMLEVAYAITEPTGTTIYPTDTASVLGGTSASLLSNFSGGSENPLSEGGNWAKLNSANAANLLRHASGYVIATTAPVSSYWTPANFGSDAEAHITLPESGSGSEQAWVAVRVQGEGGSATWDGYAAGTTSATGTVALYRVDNAVFTTLATGSVTVADGCKVGIAVHGTAIEAWFQPSGGSWTKCATATDTTYASAGKFAMGFATAVTTVRIDDAYAGTATETFAVTEREAWTSRGAGVQTDVRDTATGPTAPLQWTDTAGGTVVDWFTREADRVHAGRFGASQPPRP